MKEGYEPETVSVNARTSSPLVLTLKQTTLAVKTVSVPERKSASTPYPNIRAAKAAYNSGKLTRREYRETVEGIKEKMSLEINRLKSMYREGKISKSDYRERANAVKNRYR